MPLGRILQPLPRTTLGTGLARTGTNTGTPHSNVHNKGARTGADHRGLYEKNFTADSLAQHGARVALTQEKDVPTGWTGAH